MIGRVQPLHKNKKAVPRNPEHRFRPPYRGSFRNSLERLPFLFGMPDRLRQDDFLLRPQLQSLGQRGSIDAAPHHGDKPF